MIVKFTKFIISAPAAFVLKTLLKMKNRQINNLNLAATLRAYRDHLLKRTSGDRIDREQ